MGVKMVSGFDVGLQSLNFYANSCVLGSFGFSEELQSLNFLGSGSP